MKPESNRRNLIMRTALSASLATLFALPMAGLAFGEVGVKPLILAQADGDSKSIVVEESAEQEDPVVLEAAGADKEVAPAAATVAASAGGTIEIAVPSDPIAKAAFDVLDKNCARCHQDGKLKREKPAKNFGYVLDLEHLASKPEYIQPGNPDASRIYTQLVKKEMPYDCYYEYSCEGPSAEDISAVREWITQLGAKDNAACESRPKVSDEEIVNLIQNDLTQAQKIHVQNLRYVTLTNLYNACATDDEMEVYRQGVIKLLNSLSRSSDVLKVETIDEYKTVIRFDLEEIAWTAYDWEYLLYVYPYAGQPYVNNFDFLKQQTYTELPYIRGDFLAFVASRPPVYYDLLKLPHTLQELEHQLGFSIKHNIDKYQVKRAGMQVSGVSKNNRMIERHQIFSGPFWTSYDFANNETRQNLFEFPLGPFGEHSFKAAGGETIFALPNGFNAYYLNESSGKRLDTGPINIVQDQSQKDLSVTNAISCFGCHDQGFRKAKDDIREHILADKTFPKEVREIIAATHPEHAEMDVVLEDDTQNFRRALQRAGLDPDLKLNGVEMINALSKQYEADVDLVHAAWEFGLPPGEFLKALESVGGEGYRLKRRLEQGVIPRDRFEENYHDLLVKVTDYTIAVARYKKDDYEKVQAVAYKDPKKVVEYAKAEVKEEYKDDAYVAPKKEEYVDEHKVEVDYGVKKEAPKYTKNFELTLYSDKSIYKRKENAIFYISAAEDCYLTLINVDYKGKGTVIYPNKFQQDNFLKAGKEIVLGGDDAPFYFTLADKGYETVVAVCNASKDYVPEVKHDYDKAEFTDLGNYEEYVTRAIKVTGKTDKKTPPKKAKNNVAYEDLKEYEKVLNSKDIVARTAIKFEVK